MQTKDQLVDNIKEWIRLEKETNEYKLKIKNNNTLKKNLSVNLIGAMKENEIDCFDITGGSIVYRKNKTKKAISGKTLLSALQTYYKGSNNTIAEDVTQFILSSREENITESIKHRIDK
tara:strand:- start:2676 stop:3032 length:357 start_codon:yes stop_codon:yes gene_type:complete